MSIRTRKLKSGSNAYDVMLRRPDGTQYQRTFRTKREAERWEAQQLADQSRNVWVDPTAGRILFKDYAEEWLRNRPHLRPRTLELYRSELKRHLLPAFGRTPINAITKREVRTWHANVSAAVSQVTAAKCYRLLAAILNTAADDGLIPANACRVKGAAEERSPERSLPTVEEALAVTAAMVPWYRPVIPLAAFCTLRLGEIQGLTRADVDLLHRRVFVHKQVQELSGSGITVAETKSSAGYRVVTIPTALVPLLEEHLANYCGASLDGALLAGPRGGRRRASFYKEFEKAKTAAGAPAGRHLHDYRHLAGTLGARIPGTTAKDLMAWMGHGSERAALRYLHASAEGHRAIATGLDEVIKAARQGDTGGADRGADVG